MKMSCNGCRVLRKGCGDNCIIKPCLSWIGNPESQAHTTLFLAKFYGRTGLLNLIRAGPPHLRPAIYRSLLYESCGRIINPIFGSVGLLWSGRWHLCQAAVEAVLKGIPISQISSDDSPVKSPGSIRHVNKEMKTKLHKVSKTSHSRFKREGSKLKNMERSLVASAHELAQVRGSYEYPVQVWSPEVIEIGSPQSEEKQDNIEQEHEIDEYPVQVWSPEVIEIGSPQSEEKQDNIEQEHEIAVLDLNMEQIPRVRDTDLYKIDLNL